MQAMGPREQASDLSERRRSCIVASTPFTGSTLLCRALASTGLVGRPEDYYRGDGGTAWQVEWGFPAGYTRAPIAIKRAIAHTSSANGVFGLKMQWHQFALFVRELRNAANDRRIDDAELVARHLADPRYVWLVRHDTAEQALSYYRAICTGVWEQPPPAPDRGRVRPPDEPDLGQVRWLEDLLRDQNSQWTGFFKLHGIEPLEVVYDDVITSHESTVRRVLDFLDVGLPAGGIDATQGYDAIADPWTERWLPVYRRRRQSLPSQPRGRSWADQDRLIAPIGQPTRIGGALSRPTAGNTDPPESHLGRNADPTRRTLFRRPRRTRHPRHGPIASPAAALTGNPGSDGRSLRSPESVFQQAAPTDVRVAR